jgi:hypothetical protein
VIKYITSTAQLSSSLFLMHVCDSSGNNVFNPFVLSLFILVILYFHNMLLLSKLLFNIGLFPENKTAVSPFSPG